MQNIESKQAFNGTVWRLLPKITCGLSVVSTYTILLLFIIDRKATIDVYAEMKINSGMYVYNYQNQENIIMKRKLLRAKRKVKNDKMNEGVTYATGNFSFHVI